MMAATIEATALAKSYGDQSAVSGVSFSVAEGEIFAYLGRNGSGKTTTVRMLTTLTSPTAGSAIVAGFDVAADPMEVKSRIGVTMQDAALDPQMTGIEHLEFIAGILGHRRKAATIRSNEMLELFGLTDAATRAVATYSGGMKRRLDIATALLGKPQVLFLDEPTTGLDPQSRRAMWDEIRRLKDDGVTVFLTTQYLEEADVLADHLAIIDSGRAIAKGTPASLKAEHGRKRISFTATDTDAVERLVDRPEFDISSSNGTVHVESHTDVSDTELLHAVSDLAERNGSLHGLEITGTSLEDVFLRLTGTSINESATSATVPA